MKLIEINNLNHHFSNSGFGISNINLSIEAGSFVVIAGTNGSGKTTLLRHLNGLLAPDSGDVKLAGTTVSENPSRARQLVGMVFQDADSQIVGETVYADVAFGPENLCLDQYEIDRRVTDALKAVALERLSKQRPHLLSGGEKRRLCIAGILAMNPEIVVFDEPFSNLDHPGVLQILEQILSLHQSGHTILVATHDLEKVIAHADRLVIMSQGKIAADGPPDLIAREVESFGVRQPCTLKLGMGIRSWLN